MSWESPEYWRDRIKKWIEQKEFIVKTFGEKYYTEHLASLFGVI